AHEGHDLADAGDEVGAVEDAAAAALDGDVDGLDEGGAGGGAGGDRLGGRAPKAAQRGADAHAQPPWVVRVRRSCQKKTGLPMSAVMTPRGISAGAIAVRATRSATTSTSAPASAEAGRR